MNLYSPDNKSPLFQNRTTSDWQVIIDSRIRKTLAMLMYDVDILVKEIKEHGIWACDCVWGYIHQDATTGNQVSSMYRQLFKNHM